MKILFKGQEVTPYESFYHNQSVRFFKGTIGGGKADALPLLIIWQQQRYMKKIAILDGYNNKIHWGGVIGTVVPNYSRWGLTNGYKIIEIVYERDIRIEQKQR